MQFPLENPCVVPMLLGALHRAFWKGRKFTWWATKLSTAQCWSWSSQGYFWTSCRLHIFPNQDGAARSFFLGSRAWSSLVDGGPICMQRLAVFSKVKRAPWLLPSLTLSVKGREKGTHTLRYIFAISRLLLKLSGAIFLLFPLNLWNYDAKKKRKGAQLISRHIISTR